MFIGPFIVPRKSATEQVWLPSANRILYGRLIRWLSGNVLKNSLASDSWLGRPWVGSGCPGQYTAVSAAWRFRNTGQSCLFHASSSVCISSRSSSRFIPHLGFPARGEHPPAERGDPAPGPSDAARRVWRREPGADRLSPRASSEE